MVKVLICFFNFANKHFWIITYKEIIENPIIESDTKGDDETSQDDPSSEKKPDR
jgi:hypothetical protein